MENWVSETQLQNLLPRWVYVTHCDNVTVHEYGLVFSSCLLSLSLLLADYRKWTSFVVSGLKKSLVAPSFLSP